MVAVVWVCLLHTLDAATQPSFGQGKRFLRIVEVGIPRTTFIKSHDDVRTDDTLNIHHALRSEEVLRAIDMRAEGDSFLGDLTAMGQAEDLIATTICQDRARPAIEFM